MDFHVRSLHASSRRRLANALASWKKGGLTTMQRNLAQQNLAQQQVRDALCENLAEAGVAVELISWGDGDHPAFQDGIQYAPAAGLVPSVHAEYPQLNLAHLDLSPSGKEPRSAARKIYKGIASTSTSLNSSDRHLETDLVEQHGRVLIPRLLADASLDAENALQAQLPGIIPARLSEIQEELTPQNSAGTAQWVAVSEAIMTAPPRCLAEPQLRTRFQLQWAIGRRGQSHFLATNPAPGVIGSGDAFSVIGFRGPNDLVDVRDSALRRALVLVDQWLDLETFVVVPERDDLRGNARCTTLTGISRSVSLSIRNTGSRGGLGLVFTSITNTPSLPHLVTSMEPRGQIVTINADPRAEEALRTLTSQHGMVRPWASLKPKGPSLQDAHRAVLQTLENSPMTLPAPPASSQYSVSNLDLILQSEQVILSIAPD
ncbi:uncharacterized protein AKAW2_50014A [Aspergillus luchuensis]|uniref:Uncharacterized protein n=1 Tax=Aspergillus kawachii TaxID=1069201 RepID=A0A7R7WB13_ASPKA|nr:uncharacterized protein AKAW2_50014A [Aspergillus luchuensis]BCR99672.1 hypothetical protein AKAW2_50014A [Aspergillus luchuensis]